VVKLAAQIEATAGVELVTRFGNSLHASGRDAAALDAAIHRFGHADLWRPLPATLEDVFIFLMRGATNGGVNEARKVATK
jgi:ABC-2 type transport system ATP-binding protein